MKDENVKTGDEGRAWPPRILVVEDDPHIRELAVLSLQQSGEGEVRAVGSGDEALEVVDSYAPDLVVLDVMMPGVDGIEVYETLADEPETAGIPVVFLTARAQPDEVESYRDMGVADVVVKPFDPEELVDRIGEVWRET